jgi:hypothetical protein
MPRSLFDLVVPIEAASRDFRQIREHARYIAARRLMDEVFAEFPDVDHSFVREFQTGGFSPRVFELALFAYLREQGYDLDRSRPAPDFVTRGDVPVAIEVTTSNPAQDQDQDEAALSAMARMGVPDDLPFSQREFVFQAGKALRRKLLKRDAAGRAYWEQPHIAGVPFVVALEPFHASSALVHAVGWLSQYLYGRRVLIAYDARGRLQLTAEPIGQHQHGGKSIPSGLFALPEAAHLSAVLFTNSSTVPKFNRIGTERGYGPPDIAMIRFGAIFDPSPNASIPLPFAYIVGDPARDQREAFSEGLHVLHNPWAQTPLPLGALRDVTEHQLRNDGLVLTTFSRLDPFASKTLTFDSREVDAHDMLRRLLGQAAEDASA